MRMVGADDIETARAGVADRGEMMLGVDQVVRATLGVQIARAVCGLDRHRRADEKAAALVGPRLTGVSCDGAQHAGGDRHGVHGAALFARQVRATAMATPMPPPTHSDATPYGAWRCLIAYTSVVNTRAPLAPIGWPRAMAPPWTFTRAGSIPSS